MTPPLRVAYIFIRYPVLSQRFMQREIAALGEHGVRVEIYSLFRAGVRTAVSLDYFRWWEAFKLAVALPRELGRDPGLLRDGWKVLRSCRSGSVENFLTNVWAAIFAICRAEQFRRSKPDIVHGAWATAPATAAAILSRLCGIPFSFGAHAYDIYRGGGDAFLAPKLRRATFVHTTTATNVAYLKERAGGGAAHIILARRGLDELPPHAARSAHSGMHILSVGRLVAKKGHSLQLAACSVLQQKRIPFHLRIVGDGPRRAQLQTKINAAKLTDSVTLCGALNPSEVDEAYRWADIFWHTGIVDAEGDRDGLPNVIPEAFAHDLPVICSRTAGPMEAVMDNETGLLADANDPVELAAAVERLARDPELRRRLGENGRRWTEQNFRAGTNAALLAAAFRSAVRPS